MDGEHHVPGRRLHLPERGPAQLSCTNCCNPMPNAPSSLALPRPVTGSSRDLGTLATTLE
jgi:hypothetical protein